MSYNKLTAEILNQLGRIVGSEHVLTDDEARSIYGKDETEDLLFPPEAIVKPTTAEQVSQIFVLANKNLIPVTPRGGGTGLSGGSLSVCGGICLSMETFNRIIEIDDKNYQAIV